MTPATDRRRIAMARAGALVFDTLLVAYVMWCVHFILDHADGGAGFLGRFPYLVLVSPFVAVLWQTTGRTLAQIGYGARCVQADEQPATADQRALVGLVSTVVLLVVLAPAVLLGVSLAGVLISLATALVLLVLALRDDRARSLGERAAGVRTSVTPIPPTGHVGAWYARAAVLTVLGVLVLTFWVGAIVTEADPGELASGAGRTTHMWKQLVDPDWSITDEVVSKMVETIFIALVASALALPIAFALSFLGARNLMQGSVLGRIVYGITRFLLNLVRSVEPILWAIIFSIWVQVGPFAGMLALWVHSVAALGKLYSEAIESIDPGPVEALKATGARPLAVIRYGVVPQVVPPFLSFTVYRWDINVRMATILGFVGGGGIGDLLVLYTGLSAWRKVGVIIVFMTLVVWAMDAASAKARQRLV